MFNEQNVVEAQVIELLQANGWRFMKADKLSRKTTDIFLEDDLRKAIHKLNPDFEYPSTATEEDQILFELKKICLQSENVGLVTANENFARWVRGECTMPFGKHGQHVPVNLINFKDHTQNSYILTHQLTYKNKFDCRLDIVLYINGLPIVVGECKSPVRPAISWIDGAQDIQEYEKTITPFFVPNLLSFATESKTFKYGAVGNPIEHWGTWRAGEAHELYPLGEMEQGLKLLFDKETLLDVLQNFAIFATTKKQKKVKILCRYQQFEAVNKIAQQVKDNFTKTSDIDRQGLIWHFQGSGKSLLMVFTAMKLRNNPDLHSPTVLIVVDRVDLDVQITSTFHASDIPNTVQTENREDLENLLKQDTRKIIITTIHKFGEAEGMLNDRANIIALIDEAHRTQEGGLARKMRTALPNAFLFGLTGTPINKRDKNTFANFKGVHDLYLSKYSYQDSIRDGATLPLHFEPRLSRMQLKTDELDLAFAELTDSLEDREKASLSSRATNLNVWLKSSQRIELIVEDIVKHYQERVAPYHFKAQIVCVDREACVLYKKAIDKILGNEEESAIVMSVNAKESEYKKYELSGDEEERLLDNFRDAKHPLKFLIVTNKLLTGFDAPILQTMYLDKTIKDHNLLQAICRTNRVYPNKTHGLIVDYIGVFSDVAKAFNFDEESVQKATTNIEGLAEALPTYMQKCLAYFPNIDRTKKGFEGLLIAQECLKTVELKDAFAKDYNQLSKTWEILSPNPLLNQYEKDYVWLSQIYENSRPINNSGRLLWHAYGEKTKALIDQNIIKGELDTNVETIIMNTELLEELTQNPTSNKAKEFEFKLFNRVRKHQDNPKFQELSKNLEELKKRAEQNQINSLEFLKGLIDGSQRLIELEKKELNQSPKDTKSSKATSALTELFRDASNENTPEIIKNIVSDIENEIVRYVKVENWRFNSQSEKDVRKCLLSVLKKYQLHKDVELYNKAYKYIEEYY